MDVAKTSSTSSRSKIRTQSQKCNRLKVLHIDDDLNQLMYAKIFLEDCDPELWIESVSHPSEVVDVISVDDFDCIISDYQMDEMDGITLTQKVRKTSDVPIIIYTGRGSEEIEEVALAAGANGYVQKEMDPTHYKGLYAQILGVVHEKTSGIIRKFTNHPHHLG